MVYDNNRNRVETVMGVETQTGNRQQMVQLDVPGGTADTPLGVTIDISELKSLLIWYQTGDTTITDPCILETNSSSAPDDTLSITRDTPTNWTADSNLPNPFSADVTEIYVTAPDNETSETAIGTHTAFSMQTDLPGDVNWVGATILWTSGLLDTVTRTVRTAVTTAGPVTTLTYNGTGTGPSDGDGFTITPIEEGTINMRVLEDLPEPT